MLGNIYHTGTYYVCHAKNLVDLAAEVNTHLLKGYETVGGIAYDGEWHRYLQAVQLKS